MQNWCLQYHGAYKLLHPGVRRAKGCDVCVPYIYMYSVMLYVRGGLEYFINTATRSADRAAAGRVAATLGSLLGYSQYNVHGHASCALAVRLGEGVADLTNEPAMSYPPPSASPPRSALCHASLA